MPISEPNVFGVEQFCLNQEQGTAITPGQAASRRFGSRLIVALRPWIEAASPVLLWALPLGITLYLKSVLLNEGGGYHVFAHRESTVTAWQSFSFYRADLLYGCALIPVALIVLSRCLARRWRFPLLLSVSLIASLAMYAQLRSYYAIGRFATLGMFRTAFSWGWQEPRANLDYVISKKLFVMVLLAIVIGVAAWRLVRRMRKHYVRVATKLILATCSTGFLVTLLVVLLSWAPSVPATAFHRSVLVSAISAYWGHGEIDTRDFASLQLPDLLNRYRSLVHAPAPYKNVQYWGKAKGSNILMFVMETTPAKFLSLDGPLNDMPNLGRLRERSFVASNHFTTHPYTSRAIFSLLSSWYPSDLMKLEDGALHSDLVVPGIMRILSTLGYETGAFGPSHWQGGMDDEMYHAVGVQRIAFPRDQYPAFQHYSETRLAGWEGRRLALDEDALEQLKDDVARQMERGHPFADVFLPQISHFPLPKLEAGQSGEDLAAWEHEILIREDEWLGQLLQILEEHHQIDNTIIVVTGDHGLRTRGEDPSLPARVIDDYTFHVPLLIYAPQALQHTVTIPWATSHIDVSPSLLDLLGVGHMRDFEQGTAIWNSELRNRTTYLFAFGLMGADGYCSNGKFFMWDRISDSVYENPAPHFCPQDLVAKWSPTYLEVTRSISRMFSLQQVWETHFATADSFRNHLYDPRPR